MRFSTVLGIFLCVLALGCIAGAGETNLGIHTVSRISFDSPIRVGTALLPAGEYVVRHTMEGQDHIMVFQSVRGKAVPVKVPCKLVSLGAKSGETQSTFVVNAANEKVLQELVFRGDKAKHVF